MQTSNAGRLCEARRLVARALQLVVEADHTLAAAELEQVLDSIDRQLNDPDANSHASLGPSSAIQ